MLADRLQELREKKNFSQGDIEKATGLLRCYISRVENGHTVPSIETLEKWARALEVPLHALFHDDSIKPVPLKIVSTGTNQSSPSRRENVYLRKLISLLSRMDDHDRRLFMQFAGLLSRRNAR